MQFVMLHLGIQTSSFSDKKIRFNYENSPQLIKVELQKNLPCLNNNGEREDIFCGFTDDKKCRNYSRKI